MGPKQANTGNRSRQLIIQAARGTISALLIIGALQVSGLQRLMALEGVILLSHPHPPSALNLTRAATGGAMQSWRAASQLGQPLNKRWNDALNGGSQAMLMAVNDDYTGIIDIDQARARANQHSQQEEARINSQGITGQVITATPPTATPPPATNHNPSTIPYSKPTTGRNQQTDPQKRTTTQAPQTTSQVMDTQIPPQVAISGWNNSAALVSRQGKQIGYLKIAQVESETSGAELRALSRSLRQAGAQGLVIDIQGCPGGRIDQAALVASELIPAGTSFAHLKSRLGSREVLVPVTENIIPTWNEQGKPLPVMVVQDSQTTSACEMISGALQDTGRATIAGERSYGKASTQGTVNLGKGLIAAISQGQWQTPRGRSAGHRHGPFAAQQNGEPGLPVKIPLKGNQLQRANQAASLVSKMINRG